MAEIGVIASVIGVAGAGFRLSLILNAIGSEVANAGIEIHTISKGVTLFSLMLKQVGQHLQGHDSVHSAEALETAQRITDECQLVFDEISEMLDRVQAKKSDGTPTSPTLQQRFRWCFRKHRVTYLLAQLESLKMNLLLMLQILQLGKLMVTPPKSEATEDLSLKNDMVQQERAETQNIVIVRYWAMSRLDRLFHAAEQEDIEDRKDEDVHSLIEGGQQAFLLEAPPSPPSSTLIKLPVVSLGELDQRLNRIKESPRDMIQVSESVIDPLLDSWTRYQEILGHRDARGATGGRFAPSVFDVYESDEEHQHETANEAPSPTSTNGGGYYLEGSTTNWREPHSETARREYSRLKRHYSGLQPTVADDPEELEGNAPKGRAPSRHVIDSSPSTSSSSETDSEYEKSKARHRRRRSSGSTSDKKTRKDGRRRYQRSSYADQTTANRYGLPPYQAQPSLQPQSSRPRLVRPHPHHSVSSPLPPLHTGNLSTSPYQASRSPVAPPYSPIPGAGYIPRHGPQLQPPPQHAYSQPPRPTSTDGKGRSSSRAIPTGPLSHQLTEEEKRMHRQKQRNLRKGATRGLLGAGAIAGFLEALEGLSI